MYPTLNSAYKSDARSVPLCRGQLNVHAWTDFPRSSVPVAAFWTSSEVLLYVLVGFFISFRMTERIEQRYCIKFCQKLAVSQSETIRKIQQVFWDDAQSL